MLVIYFTVECLINASTLIFQKRELHVGRFGGVTLHLSFLIVAPEQGQY